MKKIFFLLLLSFFTVNSDLFAEDRLERQEETLKQQEQLLSDGSSGQANPGSSVVDPASSAKENLTVTAIEIKGNKSISSNTAISKMKTRVGAPYQENIISDDLKRLYLLGFFSDIKIDTEPYKEGLKVVVTVSERPIIESIVFSGFTPLRMSEEKLKNEIKSKEKQYLDYPSLTEDQEALKKLFEKIGYSQAAVTYRTDINKENNKVKIKFVASSGPRVVIRRILVSGNLHFPDKSILRLMKTKKAWLFNAGILKEDVLKEDMERIKSFYHRQGFAEVKLDYEIKTYSYKPSLDILIKIDEGKKFLIGSVALKGNQDIPEPELLLKLKEAVPGKVFSEEAIKNDVISMQGLYFDRGYIFAMVDHTTALNPVTNRVDITYDITENEVAYVDKIKIRGNVKTKDIVVRREMRIKPGDRFDGDKLRRSKERLQNLGYFEDISYDTEDTDIPNKKDLIVDVKETKTGSFSFGGGYSTVDQFVGFVEVEQKNFDWKNFPYFTGAGQDLKVRASAGSVSDGYNLSFTEPWLFDYPVSFGFDAYKQSHERDEDVGYGYDETITGADVRLGKELTEYVRGNITYRYDTIKITDISPDASNDLKKEEGENSISSFDLGLNFDNRDNVFDPKKGNIFSGNVQVAGGPFGADKDFIRFFGRASHYFPLFKESALELRARTGLIDPYGNSDDIPIYERFFAGGAYTVRGYGERSIGPIDPVSEDPLGGRSLVVGNVEYTYPLLNFFKLAFFYDTGNVWSRIDDTDLGDLKSGVGMGVRIKTPIGPIMLDYGVPLNKEPGEDEKKSGKLHFSMSHNF